MSTNAVIVVEGSEELGVYKHWDGDPDFTLPWLEQFNHGFTQSRGNDPVYKLAQLLRSSVRDAEVFGLDQSQFTGWGMGYTKSMSYDYLYILRADGTVTVTQD